MLSRKRRDRRMMMRNCKNKRRLLPLAAAALSAAFAILVDVVSGQSSAAGFINVDCGKPKGSSFRDNHTRLVYTSDFEYIDTGEIHMIDPSSLNSKYSAQAYDMRSFPTGIRNCYTIESRVVEKGGKYLVKAFFLYGNYDGKNSGPKFDLYLGVNFWTTVSLAEVSSYYVAEILTVTTSDQVSVCLINTGSGTPFISALEVRRLPPDLYDPHLSSQGTSSTNLVLYARRNFGGYFVQYPQDPYDRSWFNGIYHGLKTLTTSTSPVESRTKRYEPPSHVMETAIYSSASTLSSSWTPTEFDLLHNSGFLVILHFAELRKLEENETRIFSITVNGDYTISKRFTPSYLVTTSLSKYDPIPIRKFSLVATKQSTLPPIINAAEVFIVRNKMGMETGNDDVDAVTAIKVEYEVKKNWVGDPCSPTNFTWDGLTCSDKGFTNYRIVSINLSSSGLTGEISTSFANLSELHYLDLSNNKLGGGVPDALANLKHLKFLDLSRNRVDGPVPKVLLERAAAGSLTLRFENNTPKPNGSLKHEEERGGNSTIKIVIPLVISLALVVLSGLLVVYLLKRRKNSGKPREPNTGGKRTFMVDELVRITRNYYKQIGEGGFSRVYHGVLDDGTQVAVKKLNIFVPAPREQFNTEAHLLSTIHHKNLVSLIGSCNDDLNLALIYEYMEKGSLHDHLTAGEGTSTLSWVNRLQISVGAAKGLEYLHSGCRPAIVHRDVKPHNILLSNNMEAKISDFGLSKLFENELYTHITTKPAGTLGYIDPEYSRTGVLDEKSDVYSFGIVLLQVITGRPAIVTGNSGSINLAQWVQKRVETREIDKIVDDGIYETCDINSAWKIVEMALECASLEPIQRPTMTKVLSMLGECLDNERRPANSINTRGIPVAEMDTLPLQPYTI